MADAKPTKLDGSANKEAAPKTAPKAAPKVTKGKSEVATKGTKLPQGGFIYTR